MPAAPVALVSLPVLLAVLLSLLCAGTAAAQTVYRCTGPGGQTVFQQAPCAGAGQVVNVGTVNTVEGNPAGEAQVRAQAARSAAVRRFIAQGSVREGMTDSEMLQVMGQPVVVNTDVGGGSVRRQYVYHYPDGSRRYIYTTDGVVSGGQHRPQPVGARRHAEPCYSDREIRNAGVGLQSNTLSHAQRERIRQTVQGMRDCRR